MNDPNGAVFYAAGAVLLLAGCLKLPALWHNPKDDLLRSVCALLFTAAGVFALAAVPSVAAINRISGVPNAAAPVVYTLLTAFSGSNLVLIIRWSSGPAEAAHATGWSRRCNGATLVVIAVIIGLFALGDAPVERLVDLDTYYANTPYLREMILLYLVAHTTASVAMTVLCTRWARVVRGPLRAGLVLIVIGYVLNLAFDALKFTAIGARWGGHDLDRLSWPVAPSVAALAALLIGIGFVLPLLSQQLVNLVGPWRRYYQLQPAWKELRGATPHGIAPAGLLRTPIDVRVCRLESDIYDGILAVHPYLDPDVHALSLAEARKTARTDADAAVIADAAALAHAVVLWARRAGDHAALPDGQSGDGPLLSSAVNAAGLVLLSRALSKSPIVRATREAAVLESSTR
ncbi:MAB_1171c family putative transporter [Streptomyces sp. NPDC058401]|uniref:MAB_1171c family putative transporter n=1 Tax=Streptomyces sp. NPDC058401 TaxID=3346480 RepID=UPI00365AF8C8